MANQREKYIFRNTRTSHKRWESMVVYALHYALPDVLIESQFPIRINDKNYLVDAYLPAFGIAIEIDEEHHGRQRDADQVRQEDIERKLKCKFHRIDVRDGIYSRLNDIVKHVTEIREKREDENPGSTIWSPPEPENTLNEYKLTKIARLEDRGVPETVQRLMARVRDELGLNPRQCQAISDHSVGSNGYLGFEVQIGNLLFDVLTTQTGSSLIKLVGFDGRGPADQQQFRNHLQALENGILGCESPQITNPNKPYVTLKNRLNIEMVFAELAKLKDRIKS